MSFYQWFSSLKKETKIIIIFCVIIFIIVVVLSIKLYFAQRQLNKELDSQLKELAKKEQILIKSLEALKTSKNELQNYADKKTADYEKLKKKLKPIKDEGQKIPDIVKSYPDAKLDSVLTNHRHIKRTEN